MLGSETWIVLGAGAAIAAVIAWLIRKRELEPVTRFARSR